MSWYSAFLIYNDEFQRIQSTLSALQTVLAIYTVKAVLSPLLINIVIYVFCFVPYETVLVTVLIRIEYIIWDSLQKIYKWG